jgi:hypothetical protein
MTTSDKRGSGSLAALRLLSDNMSLIEQHRREGIDRGDDPAKADRDAAQWALTGVVAFFQDCGIQSEPLVRLLGELVALSAGSNPSRMLAPTTTTNRRPDAPVLEGIKGRLAAIVEYRQEAGLSRKAASEWVVRHIPPTMQRKLGSVKPATIGNWLVNWGGERGANPGAGRDGYLHMRAILENKKPIEADLKVILRMLARSLPA